MNPEGNHSDVLSLIVPVYNEEDTIRLFYEEIQKIVPKIEENIEINFIDDGSIDGTLNILRQLSSQDKHIHYVSFSRNFGKEAGIYAGLQKAIGKYVVVMDVDLQDPPELLPEMLEEIKGGKYDSIGTRRADRKGEARLSSWFSDQFYKLMNRFSQTQLVDGARDYRIMTRQMVDSVLLLSENQRFSKGIFTWVGFKTKYIPYGNRKRIAGTSSWSFWNRTKYAIEGVISFSIVPLTIVALLGLASFIASIIAGIFIVVRALVSNSSVAGWPSMVTIILFIGGIQMLSLGVIGRYIAAIFMETKHRPIYIAKEEK